MPLRHARRRPKGPEFANGGGGASDARRDFLDIVERRDSARHAGLVEAAGAGTVADCDVPEVNESRKPASGRPRLDAFATSQDSLNLPDLNQEAAPGLRASSSNL